MFSETIAWWIGISDSIDEGTFRYQSNGEPVPFAHHSAPWLAKEPNNGEGIEDCADMSVHNGKWNDVSCDTKKFSICEST